MELPPSSDYTDMGRMSKSPGRNYPNNTVAIVGRPAPTSTGISRLTIPSCYTHTHIQTAPCFFDTLPSTLTNLWIKMKTPKNGWREREGGKGWEQRGKKQSVLAWISRGFLPMWFPHTDSSSSLCLHPVHPFSSHRKTTQTLDRFLI